MGDGTESHGDAGDDSGGPGGGRRADGGDDVEAGRDDTEDGDGRTVIECSIGALSVTVKTPDGELAEALFERVWERRLDESEQISTALNQRMRGHQ